jgi:molybdopterin converting factor small subunit
MQIRVIAFARLRELLEASERSLELPIGSSAGDAWEALVRSHPALAGQRSSTRVAVDGRIVSFDQTLVDGAELALLPPVGGG